MKAGTSHKDRSTGVARPSSVRGVIQNSHLSRVIGIENLAHIGECLSLCDNEDNTKGSERYMSIIFRVRKNQELAVTDRQFEIIIGSLLGDAYISPLGKIQFEHSVKAHEYLKWKFQELIGIRYRRIGYVARIVKGSNTSSCRFWTRQFFRPLRQMAYGLDGKKFISQTWLERLTPLALAVWYMDDGHFEAPKQRCIIATDGFSDEDRSKLQKFLKERFDLDVVIRKSGKISMTKSESMKFFRIITPFKIACMAYKFPHPLTTNL